MNFRFYSELLHARVQQLEEEWRRMKHDDHQILLAVVDQKTRSVNLQFNTMAGQEGMLVSIRPLVTVQYEHARRAFYYSVHGVLTSTSEQTWMPTAALKEIQRRYKVYFPDGLPIPVKHYLLIGAAESTQFETPRIINFLSHIYRKLSRAPGDGAEREANRLVEYAKQVAQRSSNAKQYEQATGFGASELIAPKTETPIFFDRPIKDFR